VPGFLLAFPSERDLSSGRPDCEHCGGKAEGIDAGPSRHAPSSLASLCTFVIPASHDRFASVTQPRQFRHASVLY
jgi:hypothetical protein